MKIRTENGFTRRRTVIALLLPLMLGMSGCSLDRSTAPSQLLDLGPPSDHTSTYDQTPALSDPDISSRPSGKATHGEPIAINFSGNQILEGTDVIWRVENNPIARSYATYQWAAPPLQLVQQRVIENLSTSRAVVQDGADPFAPLLQVSLTSFEQVYAPDGKSSVGQVSMRAVLVRDHRVTDSIRLSKRVPAPTQDALGGVIALRTAADEATADLSLWLTRNLTSAHATSSRHTATNVSP